MIATSMLGSTNISIGLGDANSSRKARGSEGSGMETDKTEKLDALLKQSTKVMNENQEAEGTGTLITFKRDNKSHTPLDNQGIWTTIRMAEKKNNSLTSGEYRPKTRVESESVAAPQKIAPTN